MSGTTMNQDAAAGGLPRGVTPPSGRGGRFLSDVIVELGFAEREAVEQAFEASRAPGKKLGSTLVEMGILSEHELGRAVAERYRLDYLDLEEFDVDPEAARVIGEENMKRYEVAPVAFTEDGALVVAMVDPADWLAAEEIAQLTGRRVRRAVASGAGIAQVIARVTEASAGAEEDVGYAFEDRGPAPAPLTLRRVTNPLGRPATPPATASSQPQAFALNALALTAAPAGGERERGAEEGPPVEEPGVDRAAHQEGSGEPVKESTETEAIGGSALGRSPNAAAEHASVGPDLVEKAEPTSSDGEVGDIEIAQDRSEASEPEASVGSAVEDPEPEAEAAEQLAPNPTPPPEVVARSDSGSEAELDQARRDLTTDPADLEATRAELESTRTELESTRADRARVDEELRTTRGELASARSELTSTRGRLDGALKRTADAEREVGEARAGVSRLEAELAAAREQVESLRAEVTWSRRQIEQRDERGDHALAELRARIETMQATPAAASRSEQPGPDSGSRSATPVPSSPAASNGTDPAKPPAEALDHPTPVPSPAPEGTTVKARGLKRLIAAVRRL